MSFSAMRPSVRNHLHLKTDFRQTRKPNSTLTEMQTALPKHGFTFTANIRQQKQISTIVTRLVFILFFFHAALLQFSIILYFDTQIFERK